MAVLKETEVPDLLCVILCKNLKLLEITNFYLLNCAFNTSLHVRLTSFLSFDKHIKILFD